jgi:hypothetical protein
VTTLTWLTARQPSSGITFAMPDEHHFTLRQADQIRTDFAAIESDLEAIMERLSRLPTRKELAFRPLYVILGSAGLVILWIEMFWRHCL